MVRQGKGGVSWPAQEPSSEPLLKFFGPESKLSWHYNWNKNWSTLLPDTPKGLQIGADFWPMMWRPDFVENDTVLQDGWKVLMGSADLKNPEVAALVSSEDAAQAWIKLAKLRDSHDKKLVSPAVADDLEWLRRFFALIPAWSKPDYLAVHCYTTTFESFRAKMEDYWSAFGMPIVVSEFAMHSFDPNVPPPQTQQQVHDFMGQCTSWLDETSYIVYAWFGACQNAHHLHGVHPFNRLMDDRGELTPLGRQYVHGGHD